MAKIARNPALKRTHFSRAKEAQGCVDRIRGRLLKPDADQATDILARVKAEMAEPRRAKSTR